MQSEGNRPLAAGSAVVAAMALIALIDGTVARISELLGLWQFHFLRSLIAVPLIALWAHLAGARLLPVRLWSWALRSALFATSMMLYFGALAFLPVAEVAAGLFTAPLWVLLLTALAWKQKVGPRRVAAVATGFLGAMIVLRPSAGDVGWQHVMPVVGGFFYALSALATRSWCKDESALSLLSGFFLFLGLFGLCVFSLLLATGTEAPEGSSGFLLRAWGSVSTEAIVWLVVQAVGSVIGVYFLTRGYQLAEASYVAVFEYSILPFAMLWGALLFAQNADASDFLGISLILASGLLIAASPAARRATG